MKQELKITAEKLLENIEQYADAELLIDDGTWREIDSISDSDIRYSVWSSDDKVHVITTNDGHEWVFMRMDELTIRYKSPEQEPDWQNMDLAQGDDDTQEVEIPKDEDAPPPPYIWGDIPF